MKLPDTIRRMLFSAALAVTIYMTSQLRADAVVEDTGFPAPLPEWKTPAQLKVWRAETTAKTLAKEAAARAAQVKAVVSSATPSGFYTGKPYMAETGSYAFKYRDYNPEMARWTTVDPSGFPDGANNRVYVNNGAVMLVDNDGLEISKPGIPDVTSAKYIHVKLAKWKVTSTLGAMDGAVQEDGWSATWTALVTMTFKSPFKNDSSTKDGSATASIDKTGILSFPFIAKALIPLPAIDINPSGVADTIGAYIASKAADSLNNISTPQGANPLGVDPLDIKNASTDIAQTLPTLHDFASAFPADKYPLFTE